MSNLKTAIFFTSSGGNFSQEVAIVDQLIKHKKLVLNENDTFLAAFGTGAINLVAINACFRSEKPMSWDHYYKEIFLSTISDEEIFIKTHPVQWCTHPQRKRITQFLNINRFICIGDLPFSSAIITSENLTKKTKWLKSNSDKFKYVDLGDALMASSSLPVFFPPQLLNSVNDLPVSVSDNTYVEGAKNGIFAKFKKQIKEIVSENGSFEQLFIISPQRANSDFLLWNLQYKGMSQQDKHSFSNFLDEISLNQFLVFLFKLERLNWKRKFANKIYICIPEFENEMNILDFSNQMDKYKLTYNWFEKNTNRLAIELDEFNRVVNSIA